MSNVLILDQQQAVQPRISIDMTSHSAPESISDETEKPTIHSNYVPAQLERHLEFLDFNAEGHMILGCSNLTGRYWIGSLWYYKNPLVAPSVEEALTGVDCDNGIIDGFFTGKEGNQMFVALDNGAVEHITLAFNKEESEPSFPYLERVHSVQEHDDIITGISQTCDDSTVLTCSYDKSIVALDAKTLALTKKFSNAHEDLITSLSTNKCNANIFASAGADGIAGLWDLREEQKCQAKLYDNVLDWPTTVEFLPTADNHLLIGNQSGEVHLYDTRKPELPIAKVKAIDKQIYRIRFSPKDPALFAVCGDSFPVKGIRVDTQKAEFITEYDDQRHDDFVRGLAWNPESNQLFSCSWDHQILVHNF